MGIDVPLTRSQHVGCGRLMNSRTCSEASRSTFELPKWNLSWCSFARSAVRSFAVLAYVYSSPQEPGWDVELVIQREYDGAEKVLFHYQRVGCGLRIGACRSCYGELIGAFRGLGS